MLRLDDKIRLTSAEQRTHQALTGTGAPTTVQQHDAQLEEAAQVWEQGESAEEQLAAMLARDLQIAPQALPGAPVAAKD